MLDAILSEIAYSVSKDPKLEWADKYGTTIDNDTFMMHPYCWCERDECLWCGEESTPNFWYKPLDFKVWWYKYIGRGMEINKELTAIQLATMVIDCLKWSK